MKKFILLTSLLTSLLIGCTAKLEKRVTSLEVRQQLLIERIQQLEFRSK